MQATIAAPPEASVRARAVSVDRTHPGLGLARRFRDIGRAVLLGRSLLQCPQLRLNIVEIRPVDERVDHTDTGAFHEGEQFLMAGAAVS